MKNNRLYLYVFLYIFLFCPRVYGQGAGEISTQQVTFLTYGGTPKPFSVSRNAEQNAIDIVAKKWSIAYQRIANCAFTQAMEDSANSINEHHEALLRDKYGTDWLPRYEQEVSEEYNRLVQVVQLISEQDYIKAQKKVSGNLYYYATPVTGKNSYLATASGQQHVYQKWIDVIFYRMEIDLGQHTVKLLSGITEEK